jgi:Ca-activated chloride channel family protein
MKLDEPSLKAVAFATQGAYYYAGNAEDLKKVYAKLGTRLQVDKKETEISSLLSLVAAVLAISAAALSLLWFNRIL